MAEGELIVTKKGQVRVRFVNKNGKSVEAAVPQNELSRSIAAQLEEHLSKNTADKLTGMKVELEEVGGQPKKVRPVGEPFESPVAPMPTSNPGSQTKKSGAASSHSRQPQPAQRGAANQGGGGEQRFHNPYNFVPALPRDKVGGDLGDSKPAGHHVLFPDRYSGVIRVCMTAKTPLLVPDAGRLIDYQKENEAQGITKGHKSYPVRLDPTGKPYIPPTSVKGMLRAAYEAVTNSRLAVFPGHDRKLANRMVTQEGLALVPARIDNNSIQLLPGTATIGANGPQGPMYAAWLPRYHNGQVHGGAVRYPNNELPQHGDAVECWIELFQHKRWNNQRQQHVRDFQLWRVRAICKRGDQLPNKPAPTPKPNNPPRHNYCESLGRIERITGWVCVTNANIDRKHDERVFFSTKEDVSLPLTDDLVKDWETLIRNYQEEHEDEIARGLKCPPALQRSHWSRQIVGINGNKVAERQLKSGTLCYAAVKQTGATWSVVGLYPVNISRKLFDVAPLDLLPESLRPADAISKLSPADRVFGWVNQEGKGAYRGQVRIGPVECHTDNALETFGEPGVPLAILGAPKPQQTRFYVAASPRGEPQQDRVSKEQAGYRHGKGLRGRKVYPHHQGLPDNYWDKPLEDRTQRADNGRFQEYRRPKLNGREQRDDQNRSVLAWIKPGAQFSFDIYVRNLSAVELGALLWLLELPEGHYHRFGGGKPLGFGSVRLSIDWEKTHLAKGDAWRTFYCTLQDTELPKLEPKELIEAFKTAVGQAYGGKFEEVSFIKAWLRAATGHPDNLPTHYPRARQEGQSGAVPPHPEGKAYEWFVENDRTGRNGGPNLCLPDLHRDTGLPIL